MKILIGTKNLHKALEMKSILINNIADIEIITIDMLPYSIEEPIENGESFYENALIKAKYYYEKTKLPVIVDDSGLEIKSLNNRPGILSARYASEDNLHATDKDNRIKVLKELQNITDRNARFICEMLYYDGSNLISSKGILEGTIDYQEKGSYGFGYDSIFYLRNYQMTLGEINEVEKNLISHRYLALSDLIKQIKDLC